MLGQRQDIIIKRIPPTTVKVIPSSTVEDIQNYGFAVYNTLLCFLHTFSLSELNLGPESHCSICQLYPTPTQKTRLFKSFCCSLTCCFLKEVYVFKYASYIFKNIIDIYLKEYSTLFLSLNILNLLLL